MSDIETGSRIRIDLHALRNDQLFDAQIPQVDRIGHFYLHHIRSSEDTTESHTGHLHLRDLSNNGRIRQIVFDTSYPRQYQQSERKKYAFSFHTTSL